MQDLIQELVQKAGITEAQATQSLMVTKEYIQRKLPPQMAAMVDGFFAGNLNPSAGAGPAMHTTQVQNDDWIDKAQDFAGDAGKKLGAWGQQAEEVAEDAIAKIKGMFSGSKKDNAEEQERPIK